MKRSYARYTLRGEVTQLPLKGMVSILSRALVLVLTTNHEGRREERMIGEYGSKVVVALYEYRLYSCKTSVVNKIVASAIS